MRLRMLPRIALAATMFAALPATTNAVAKVTAISTAATDAQHLANLKSKGSTEIDRRITNLTAAQGKLDASTKLQATDKATFGGQVRAEETGLNALKTKLAAETTLAGARADVASIVSDYRVYVLMLPKVRLVAATDRFDDVEQQLTALSVTLKAKLDAAKSAGKDVTFAQASLADLIAKTADATSKTTGLTATLLAIQPADYDSNHAALAASRAKLELAHTDVVAARADATTIVNALKALNK